MKTILILFSLLVITSCNGQKTNLANSEHESQFTTGEFDLADTTYFVMVKNYVRVNGKELIITYYSTDVDGMEVSIDHTDRIYMNMDNQHFGNILKEKGTVVPEIIYGVPDSNPALTKQKEKKVLEIYRSLIARALSK